MNVVKHMIESIFDLKVSELSNAEQVDIFCGKNKAIEQQFWLNPESLQLIVNNGNPNRVTFFEDILNIRIIMIYYKKFPYIIGPYLDKAISRGKCIQLCNFIDKKNMNPDDLLIYYGKYPILDEDYIDKILRAIENVLELGMLEERHLTYIDRQKDYYIDDRELLMKISNNNIEHHYHIEHEYMEAIKEGNFRTALHYKKMLRENASGLWTGKQGIECLKVAYAINRCMTRIAAYEAGVPASMIHKITMRENASIDSANSEKQMEKVCNVMIKEFCDLIKKNKEKNYSALVQSIIYFISKNYWDTITVKSIAEELEISESYMIAEFKNETGKTPAIYLREVRMKKAASLLKSTEEEISKVSNLVGISDANYFVKLFKTCFDMTPKEYRKLFKI